MAGLLASSIIQVSLAGSMGVVPKSLYFNLNNQGNQLLLEAEIKSWISDYHVHTLEGPSVGIPENAKPYLYFRTIDGLFSSSTHLVPLDSLESAEGLNKYYSGLPWVVKGDGQTYTNIHELRYAMCSPGNGVPDVKNCVFNSPKFTSYKIYGNNGVLKTMGDDYTWGYDEWQKELRRYGTLSFIPQDQGEAWKSKSLAKAKQEEKQREAEQRASDRAGGQWVMGLHQQALANKKKGKLTAAECMYMENPPRACDRLLKAANARSGDGERDAQGRRIIRGTVYGPASYNNVHIIAEGYGIDGSNVSVTNSVIEANQCVNPNGVHLNVILQNNQLQCD